MTESGWKIDGNSEHDWEQASGRITDYIKSINWGYKKKLNDEKIQYYNKKARLLTANSIEL